MGAAVLVVASRVGSDEGGGAILRSATGVAVGLVVFLVTVVALRTEEVSALRTRFKRA
jgi:hypothetical protein